MMMAVKARPNANLMASQRVRVMLWDQAKRFVPCSISRATNGAPKRRPRRAGTALRMKML